ncbi:MAG: phenylalanine--tRNA ligase subunit alpha [Dehalococcoidales bacterium]|nr:phenylalanine--tRNA ligase subunit alpha [Dehalococcoidales bacterium]
MLKQLDEMKANALQVLEGITHIKDLEAWRVHYLGKKSPLTAILRGLAELPIEERKAAGSRANETKRLLEESFLSKEQKLREAALISQAQQEAIDITLPGRPLPAGHLHPLTQTLAEICDIFQSMGFQVATGPEVEWDYYNFEALNIPAEHPARDTMSSSWVDALDDKGKRSMLLRTHTTSVSARSAASRKPPIRVIEPGKVYRYEASDATHVPMFHQVDGLAVDRGITMADLKGTLYEFARRFFGPERNVRFRVDFFPFVEPGVEMAIECLACHGSGCRLCKSSGWIEVAGAGMTHPKVLERGGIDPEVYSSFAFGFGVDRLPMLRYGIDDVRLFYGNDLRFLRQF